MKWFKADNLPHMHTESVEDFDDIIEYEISDPVLGITHEGNMVVVQCSYDSRKIVFWFDINGQEYKIAYWCELPDGPTVTNDG